MNWQGPIVLLLILAAVGYLLYQLWRRLKRPRPGAGGCGCCTASCAARQLKK